MNQEFEIISHSQMNFKLFLVNMLYRTPHIHKDFELCLLLDGSLFLQAQNETHSLETGDFFVVNPFQSHELKADSPALLVSLQVHPSFFFFLLPADCQSGIYLPDSSKGRDGCLQKTV